LEKDLYDKWVQTYDQKKRQKNVDGGRQTQVAEKRNDLGDIPRTVQEDKVSRSEAHWKPDRGLIGSNLQKVESAALFSKKKHVSDSIGHLRGKKGRPSGEPLRNLSRV